MSPAEKALIVEGLKLADDAMARLMDVNNEHIQFIARLLHTAIFFGENFLRDSEAKQ